MQEITPPAKIDISPVKLSAEANWLVCEKICIPGGANLELELPTSTTAVPKNTDLFARYRRLLPQKFPDSKTAAVTWNRTASDLHLKIVNENLANYPTIDFYPLPQGNTVVGHPSVQSRKGNEIIFRIPIESPDKNLSAMPGLIVFSKSPNGNDRTAWQLGTPAIAAAQAAQPSRGIVTFLFFGFIGGFILNLMPCVLPVISLKIFGFIKQAGESRAKIFRSGLPFTAGIFAWFIGLALLLIALKSAGRDVTWGGFQFTNAYFVLTLSVIVLVFALNLFGVFELSLPQILNRGMLASAERKDDLGSFF